VLVHNINIGTPNLISVAASIEKMFTLSDSKFDLVFNLAAETKYSQTDEVYKEKILDLSVKCATEAAKQGVERFVEVSTAQIYEAKKVRTTASSLFLTFHLETKQRRLNNKTVDWDC